MGGCYETPGKKHWGLNQGSGVGSEGQTPERLRRQGLVIVWWRGAGER